MEPYSLRRTNDGNLLLFVVNDYGARRGYRVDRMAGARPTSETFIPRYRWSSSPGLTSQDGEPYFVAVAGVGAASSCSA